MNRRDWTLTAMVILVWGANFTVTKIGITNVPPMLLAAIRFFFVAFPAIFFVKRPRIHWLIIVGYGMTIGVLQFSCLYYAIYIGMPAGLSSVVIQASSFITILLAVLFFRERLPSDRLIGLGIALTGLMLIGAACLTADSGGVPLVAVVLTVGAAFFWSLSTVIVKSAAIRSAAVGEPVDMLGLVAWSALVPPVPMLLLGLTMNTPAELLSVIRKLNLTAILSVLFLAWCSTLFGSVVWNRMLSRYDAGRVAPLSLMVPAAGLLIARLTLDERLTFMQWMGSIVILIGLLIFNIGFKPIRSIVKRS